MLLPLLAASDWGIAVAIFFLLIVFVIVGFAIIQGTRAQLYWRKRVEEGDTEAIQALVGDEIMRWKTARAPRGVDPAVWHGVQGAELLEVKPDSVRVSAAAEGRYALVSGERREVSTALAEGMRLASKLADMVLYDIPNVKLADVRIDIYSTYRDAASTSQQCILTVSCSRDVADVLDWDDMEAEEIMRAFGARFQLDDHGRALPLDPEAGPSGVPAVFYEDD
ncbi:MAG TPA: hypothetical protein VFY79_00860 [Dehalococcoidia bacterium]|jgi:hypothetical protein|nr:hypothetical protein [Dehalococcoidia bacterium]